MGLVRDTHTSDALQGERIAKIIARSGLCSRRDAERLISEGRVTLNGKRLDTPAVNISASDTVLVDNEVLPQIEPPRLWRFHKPKGCVTTHRDPEGRPTVFDTLPETMPRVISIGRLDFNTEGLLLLTNDGGLARHLESPATGWLRRYRVRVNGNITQTALDALADGITIEGVRYAGIEAKLDRTQGTNSWLTVGLREGKNREIRRIMTHLGVVVNRLIRVSYGPFALGELETGAVEEIKRRVVADQLGLEIAERLGLKAKKVDSEGEKPVAPGRSNTQKRSNHVRSEGGKSKSAPKPKPAYKSTFKDQTARGGDVADISRPWQKKASAEGKPLRGGDGATPSRHTRPNKLGPTGKSRERRPR
jgi:23S rRNA pseudouridine2605 synthase